jgi:hypothetical protein
MFSGKISLLKIKGNGKAALIITLYKVRVFRGLIWLWGINS